MILPQKNKFYIYNNDIVIMWAQDLFINVYARSQRKVNNNYNWYKINWFEFVFKAKNIK